MAAKVGPFELLKSIGTGGMAEVWSAVFGPTQTLVALKVLREAGNDDLTAAFRREVRAAASLNHPFIALIYEQGTTQADEAFVEGTPWLAMELARNGTLRARRGNLRWNDLRDTLIKILAALGHAHARGVIHRDIKPGNVLIGQNGPLLADFGLAHELGRSSREDGPGGGSPAYMAPEQFRRSDAEMGPWTDLYGLGCLTWALATGKPPFTGHDTLEGFRSAHLNDEPHAYRPLHTFPPEFEAWTRTLLAKAPADRPRTAADASWTLQQLPGLDEDAVSGPLPAGILPPPTGETWHDLPLEREDAPEVAAGRLAMDPPAFPTSWRRRRIPPRPTLPGVGLGLLGTREVPIVGREQTRDALWAELGLVHAQRRARAVILRGRAGLGAARMAQWLCRRAHATGAALPLVTTHSPVAPPGAGLAWLVANLLRIAPLPFDLALDRIARAPELSELSDTVDRAALAGLLDRLHAGRPVSKGELDAGFTALITALTRQRPLLLWLARAEHSATSLAFTDRMIERTDRPVLLVLSMREEDLAGRPAESALVERLQAHERVLDVPVGLLPQEDHPALVRAILPLEPGLARRIEQCTKGHPGFTTQLVRDLVHRDLLVPTDQGFTTREEVELPTDLADAWARRLQGVLKQLSDEGARALSVAALLWSDLVDATWIEVCRRTGANPARTIEPLLEQGLAHPLADGGGWSFAPGLRDALTARPADDHIALHRICVDVVRVRDGGAETEAHHLLAAGDVEEALAPLLQAAEERIALGHYDEALDLLDLRQVAPPDHRFGQGQVLRSAIFRYKGNPDAAEAALARVMAHLDEPGWEQVAASAAVAWGALAYQRGSTWKAVEHLRDAEERYLALGLPSPGLPACRVHLADCLMRLGRLEEARDALSAAHAGFEELGKRVGAANAMLALGGLHLRTGEADEAQRWLDLAGTAYEEAGVRFGLAETWNRRGEVARQRGDTDEAERCYKLSAAGYGAIGSADGLVPRLNLGLVLLQRKKWEAAADVLRTAGEQAVQQQRRDLETGVRVLLLPAMAALARWPDFNLEMRQARSALRTSGFVHPDLGEQALLAARICSDANQPQRARKAATMALDQWLRLNRDDQADQARALLGTLD